MNGELQKKQTSRKMVVVTFHLPASILEAVDTLVQAGIFVSRADAFRTAVTKLVQEEYKFLTAQGVVPWTQTSSS